MQGSVSALVVVVVKIRGYAGLGIGQITKSGSLALFECLSFEPEPEALSLRVVKAFAAATVEK